MQTTSIVFTGEQSTVKAPRPYGATQHIIVEYLREHPFSTRKEIAADTGIRLGYVWCMLQELIKKGILEQRGLKGIEFALRRDSLPPSTDILTFRYYKVTKEAILAEIEKGNRSVTGIAEALKTSKPTIYSACHRWNIRREKHHSATCNVRNGPRFDEMK